MSSPAAAPPVDVRSSETSVHVEALETAANSLPLALLPALEGDLARITALIRLRYALPPSPPDPVPGPEDRLLKIGDAAARLDVTVPWLYRNHRTLSFTRRVGRQHLRFSEAGIARFVAQARRTSP